MSALQTFSLALRALLRNKTRSLLTTLGIVIGVASVISMVGVGDGARARVESLFSSMGTNMLIVLSGSTSSGGVMGGFGSMPTLTWDDLIAIQTQAPAVRLAAPVANLRATLVAEEANWTTGVVGTTSEYFEIRSWQPEQGSIFSADDIASAAKVRTRPMAQNDSTTTTSGRVRVESSQLAARSTVEYSAACGRVWARFEAN